MKHKHYDVMMEWAADTNKTVQLWQYTTDEWVDIDHPIWNDDAEYRIKPEPLPDVIVLGVLEWNGSTPSIASYHTTFRVSEHYEKDNVRAVFDGETGKLKTLEVL